jgi:hypothetical protein
VEDYAIPGVEGVALHHLYRAMAWLGSSSKWLMRQQF